MSAKGPHVQDSVEAEVLACRRAPEFAIDIGFFELMIEGDNAQVLNSILSSDTNQSQLGHVIADIQFLVASLNWAEVT